MSIGQFPAFHGRFGDGIRHGEIPEASLAKLKSHLPESIYALLQNDGVSSYMDGFLWTLDPEDYTAWLNAWWGQPKQLCVPFARTALGDFICVTKNVEPAFPGMHITVVFAARGELNHLIHRADWLFDKYLVSDRFLETQLGHTLFTALDAPTRALAPGECLGFEPLLSLGGSATADHLRRCKLREYALLVSDAAELRTVL